jgi:hypothetical protein
MEIQENIFYFELHKKDKNVSFQNYTYIHKFVFSVAQNTVQFLPKFRTSIQDLYMFFFCNRHV